MTWCSSLGYNMKTLQQERGHGSPANTQSIALQEDKRFTLSTSLPKSETNFNQDKSSRPYTTLIIIVVTNAAQIQQQTPSPNPSQPPHLSSNASITSVATSTSSPQTPFLSTKHWHITQIGTVVSESEIPKAWAPKFLDVEKAQLNVFLGCAALLFIVTIVGIVGTGMVRERLRSGRRWI
jgi:hypothetical protein